jgi:hypothetical protein
MSCAPGLVSGLTKVVGSYFHVLSFPDSFSAVHRVSGPVFMFCDLGLVFGGAEGVGSRFHVFRPHIHFQRYRGRRVQFSYFVRPDLFSTVPRESCPVFMFCASELTFDGAECVGSCFHVFRSRTCFRRCGDRRVPFSCFALRDTFSSDPRASGLVFMFSTPGIIFGGTKGVGCRYHVLRSRTHFRRYRVHRVSFSCFASPDSFSAVPRTSFPFSFFALPD